MFNAHSKTNRSPALSTAAKKITKRKNENRKPLSDLESVTAVQ